MIDTYSVNIRKPINQNILLHKHSRCIEFNVFTYFGYFFKNFEMITISTESFRNENMDNIILCNINTVKTKKKEEKQK